MDQTILVAADIATGPKIVNILERAGLRLNVAMWLQTPEYQDLRFVLASRDLDGVHPREAYGIVHRALDSEGFTPWNTPALMILRMTDPFVRALRKISGRAKHREGMRLGGRMIGDRFVEDGIVYRIQ